MIRMLLTFVVMYAIFYFGIPAIRKMSGLEKWDLMKTVSYATMCTVLAVAALTVMVVVF